PDSPAKKLPITEKVRFTPRPTRAVVRSPPRRAQGMADNIVAQIAALKGADAKALKARWRELFGAEPPPYNRRFLESRLAYRLQELAYGGLAADTLARLAALGAEATAGRAKGRKRAASDRPVSGTRLLREWKGVEHQVTVRDQDFEYQG